MSLKSSGYVRKTDPSVPPSSAQTPFRSLIPDPDHPRIAGIANHTARTWCDSRLEAAEPAWLINRHDKANMEPEHIGFSHDGKPNASVWQWEDDSAGGAPTEEAYGALAELMTKKLDDEGRKAVYCGDLFGKDIRLWSNPELYVNPGGIRLDETTAEVRGAIREITKVSLSTEGYEKIRNCCLTNGFLGRLVNGRGVLNEHSYNFRVFGDVPGVVPAPADGKKRRWAWTLFGHHLCVCVVFSGNRMVIGPNFMGAEPDEIDEGPFAGLRLFRDEEMLGLRLMQAISPDLQKRAQLSVGMDGDSLPEGRWNPFDERHLGGARQDNRVVPYEGCPVSLFTPEQRETVLALFKHFNVCYPAAALAHRVRQFEQHLDQTYFAWIGGFTDRDPYYYRIHSPVAFLEFDFHCGIFLTNTSPAHCHIHTINRLPNRGDYGRALLDLD